jgi:hypothetical protein
MKEEKFRSKVNQWPTGDRRPAAIVAKTGGKKKKLRVIWRLSEHCALEFLTIALILVEGMRLTLGRMSTGERYKSLRILNLVDDG